MLKIQSALIFLLLGVSPVVAQTEVQPPAEVKPPTELQPQADAQPPTELQPAPVKTPTKSLTQLTKTELPGIAHIEIKGENPELIYIPILHDNPEHRDAAETTRITIEENLRCCQAISEHLYENYGVRNILLEGISKTLSDKYNSPKFAGRKLSVGKSKSIIFKVWFDILNETKWNLVEAYETKTHGPLTQLGSEYTTRIQQALKSAHGKGWFSSREIFDANQVELSDLIAQACEGYNERFDAIVSEDPGLKHEYDIVAVQRNKVFIENALKAAGPGIIMCGGGHIQDLEQQCKDREISYMIIVPEGIPWPPAVKDDDAIYADMLKLGCQLKKCTLNFGDGTSSEITIPIK